MKSRERKWTKKSRDRKLSILRKALSLPYKRKDLLLHNKVHYCKNERGNEQASRNLYLSKSLLLSLYSFGKKQSICYWSLLFNRGRPAQAETLEQLDKKSPPKLNDIESFEAEHR